MIAETVGIVATVMEVEIVIADTVGITATMILDGGVVEIVTTDTVVVEVHSRTIMSTLAAWTKISFGIFQGALGILGPKGVSAPRSPKTQDRPAPACLWGPGPLGMIGDRGPWGPGVHGRPWAMGLGIMVCSQLVILAAWVLGSWGPLQGPGDLLLRSCGHACTVLAWPSLVLAAKGQ